MSMLSIGEVCRLIGDKRGVEIPPQRLSDLLYRRILDVARCPVVGKTRRIPTDYVPAIEAILDARGLLADRAESGVTHA